MKKLNNKGMTLVETTVAIAIITISSLMLATGFLAAGSLIKRGVQITKASEEVGEAVEKASFSLSGGDSGSATLTINGVDVTVGGRYFTQENTEDGVKYSVFVAN